MPVLSLVVEARRNVEIINMQFMLDLAVAGLLALKDYVATHVLTCLIPAFLLAGAMVAFINKQAILPAPAPSSLSPADCTTRVRRSEWPSSFSGWPRRRTSCR